MGSLLVGDRETIWKAHRYRKMLGGGMRQAGILAAAGLYALDHHVERLAEDHANARLLAEGIAGLPAVRIDPAEVETNIVIFDLVGREAKALMLDLKAKGVLVGAIGPQRIRMVTHLDVSGDECRQAVAVLRSVLT